MENKQMSIREALHNLADGLQPLSSLLHRPQLVQENNPGSGHLIYSRAVPGGRYRLAFGLSGIQPKFFGF